MDRFLISIDDKFNTEDYIRTEVDRGKGYTSIYYGYYINGFNTNIGYRAAIEDNKLVYVSKQGSYDDIDDDILNKAVVVTEKIENEAKELAVKYLPGEYTVMEQSIRKEIINSKYCLVVSTIYVEGNVIGGIYSEGNVSEYIYEL